MKVLQCQSCKRDGVPLLHATSEDLRRHCACGASWLPEDDVMVDIEPGAFKEVEISREDFQKLYGWVVGT